MNRFQIISPPPPPVGTAAKPLSPRPIPFLFITFGAMIILAGCPSPGGGGGETGGGVNPGNPTAPERTLSFTLELSEPNGNPLELGSGPSRTAVTSDVGIPAVGTVRGKAYSLTVTQVPSTAASITLTVKKTGFLNAAIGPIPIPPTGNPLLQTKTIPYAYTTAITGKVTTPAGKAVTQYDTTTRLPVSSSGDAEVRASTNSAVTAAVAADGSYTLRVKHPGTFTLSVDYPAGRDYKAGSSQSVTTTKAAHTQDVALKYGYTTTLSGQVFDTAPAGPRNEVPIIIEVEGFEVTDRGGVPTLTKVEGREAARTVSRTIGGTEGSYSITFDHPGSFWASASFEGRSGNYSLSRNTGAAATTGSIVLRP